MTVLSSDNHPYEFTSKELLDVLKSINDDFANSHQHEISELVLMPLDPNYLHVYWNVSDEILKTSETGESLLESRYIIRFYSVEENAVVNASCQFFDIDAQGRRNQRNVRLPYDGCHYVAELGIGVPGGEFEALLRSNVISVPKIKLPPCQEPELDNIVSESVELRGVPLDKEGVCVYWDSEEMDRIIKGRMRKYMPNVDIGNLLKPDLYISSFSNYSSSDCSSSTLLDV